MNALCVILDVDECSQGAVCLEEGQSCSNTVGSYKCNCADGYIKKDGGCIKKKGQYLILPRLNVSENESTFERR